LNFSRAYLPLAVFAAEDRFPRPALVNCAALCRQDVSFSSPVGNKPARLLGDDMTNYFDPKYDGVLNALTRSLPQPARRNALLDWYTPPSNALSYDYRLKTEYVPGYNRTVPNGLLGYRQEWVPDYWRREG
jgi:hypothetical protein